MRLTAIFTFLLLAVPAPTNTLATAATTIVQPAGLTPQISSLALAFHNNGELAALLCDSKGRCGTFVWNFMPRAQPVRLQNDLFDRNDAGHSPAFDSTATRTVDRGSTLLASLKDFRAGYDQAYRSAEGGLLLVVRPERKVSTLKRLTSFAIAVATFGIGVEDEPPNQALVLVVNTLTNQQCMHLIRERIGPQMIPWAAISPDGNFIALAVGNRIELFDISGACARQRQTASAHDRKAR